MERVLRRGIEGYYVQIASGENAEVLDGFTMTKKSSDINEVYVPKERFKEFMAKTASVGLEIELIEPKRKDIEAFFLEIVSENQ